MMIERGDYRVRDRFWKSDGEYGALVEILT